MIVYHGSDVTVEKPRLIKSTRKLDFGAGFYNSRSPMKNGLILSTKTDRASITAKFMTW